MTVTEKLKTLLNKLYPNQGEEVFNSVLARVDSFTEGRSIDGQKRRSMSEKDLLLITYPQQIQDGSNKPLKTLAEFYKSHLKTGFSGAHLLPFYPSTSDGGFAVSAYDQVDPDHGSWQDIAGFTCDLMFDGVFNHTSSQHPWFLSQLNGAADYQDYFHVFNERPEPGSPLDEDLKKVVRPRSTDLLAPFSSPQQEVYAWATFGPDQVDVNYANPQVLLEFVDILFLYLKKGATFLRVDAVPFFWKELGTNCVHHDNTHVLVQVFRTILDLTYPQMTLVTESNVPHKENISYLGNGTNEAQMVYNFSLAPLILYSLIEQNCTTLKSWVAHLEPLPEHTTFFNFTATHDGIGVRPLEGILSEKEILTFTEKLKNQGGLISYRSHEGTEKPYEVNITWASSLKEEDHGTTLQKILCSYAMSLVFPGVPGVYFHNLLGTLNWYEGYQKTKHKRDINRRMYGKDEINSLLKAESLSGQIFKKTIELLEKRRANPSLHPKATFKQLNTSDAIWAVQRQYEDHSGLFLFNVSAQTQSVILDKEYKLEPYQFLWEFNN